jgi:hypothetical protein
MNFFIREKNIDFFMLYQSMIRNNEGNQLILTNPSMVEKEQISPSEENVEGINPNNLKSLLK